ncbi:MAG TPA: hypothetical protein VM056_06165 [Terriglobales bacterium]|nr:hypothetical protein [Terriglobales bacterium]
MAAIAFPLGGWGGYLDISSDDTVRPYFFVVIGLVSSLLFFCGSIVIERYLGKDKDEKLTSMRAISDWKMDKAWGALSVLRGTYLGFLLLFLDLVLTLLLMKFAGAWQDGFINVEIQGWYLSRWFPGLQILTSALLQTFGIGLIVGVTCAAVWRFNSRRFWRVSIPAILLGASGIAWYLGAIQPNYLKVILLILDYTLISWVFVKFDLLTSLVTQFTFAFIWGLWSIYLMGGQASHSSEAMSLSIWLCVLGLAVFHAFRFHFQNMVTRTVKAVS